jgi:hypothetical protein
MVFNTMCSSVCAGNEMTPIVVAPQCLTGYKYSSRQAPQSISHFFSFSLRVFSPSLHLLTMEDKKCTKHSRSSASDSLSSSSDASTPLSSPFESLPPPVSPSDVSSHRPPSPVREHDGPSEEILVVDLSSRGGR